MIPRLPAILRSERLVLRYPVSADLTALHRVYGNDEAMRYGATLPHGDLEETRRWLAARLNAVAAGTPDYVVMFRGEVIGKAGFVGGSEIGIILHPDHWGSGIAGEALRTVIDATFDANPPRPVTAEIDPRNTASLRLFKRLGFVETGRATRTVQIGGEWYDSVYLELRSGDRTWVDPAR